MRTHIRQGRYHPEITIEIQGYEASTPVTRLATGQELNTVLTGA
jgi:hypothetical protein